jgi:riboflavin kinase/FMN adenylyltransferase
MMNIGIRPTISAKNNQIETHLFDFNGNLYGHEMTLEILEKIREEKKFKSIEKLKIQLDVDKKHCQKLIPQYL